jgi:hypothetical protein
MSQENRLSPTATHEGTISSALPSRQEESADDLCLIQPRAPSSATEIGSNMAIAPEYSPLSELQLARVILEHVRCNLGSRTDLSPSLEVITELCTKACNKIKEQDDVNTPDSTSRLEERKEESVEYVKFVEAVYDLTLDTELLCKIVEHAKLKEEEYLGNHTITSGIDAALCVCAELCRRLQSLEDTDAQSAVAHPDNAKGSDAAGRLGA